MKLVSNQNTPPETAAPGATEPTPPLSDLPALTRLKNLPAAERDLLLDLKRTRTCPQMIALVHKRHGIEGLTQPTWSKFAAWMNEQRQLRAANEAVANIREIFHETMPGADAEATHKFLLHYLTSLGFAQKGDKQERALRFVATEMRHAVSISQHERRLRLLEQQAENTKEALADSGLTEAEKNQRIREIFHRAIRIKHADRRSISNFCQLSSSGAVKFKSL